jgi:diguanylate cyclase (GGDEF)-like protein
MSAPSEHAARFGILDAARVVARGGRLDARLSALAEGAAVVAGASRVTVLLLDEPSGVLTAAHGGHVLPVNEAGEAVARALREREPVAGPVPGLVAGALPGAVTCLVVPLHIEDDQGVEVEGLLVLGWGEGETPAAPTDELAAVADLIAVAIHQGRLQQTLWGRSDEGDQPAHTDRLTGLANRVTFERMLELEIARATRQGSPLAVAVLDVAGLRAIGERKGARVADEVLRHVAAALADRVRLLDTVARFEEAAFAVIAPGDASGVVALRLRDAIAELPPVDDVHINVSAAVVHHPADGATGSELLAASEAALESARSAGPGVVLGARTTSA